MTDNPSRTAWADLTFEQVCNDHVAQIKHKLEIAGVLSEVSSWKKDGSSDDGAQIDLIIDRRDRVINLCEIKFTTKEFEISKNYDLNLKNKVELFKESTGTKCTLQLTMITTYGIKRNKYSNYVSKEICLDDLFC